MNIRRAEKSDVEILLEYDKHISKEEMESVLSFGRVSVAENSGTFIGWLRRNLFWDNTPFLNRMFLFYKYRNSGCGKEMLSHWEQQMKAEGHALVMTSSLANEEAQHFYGKSGYIDSGALLLSGEPLEIIFVKRI